METLTEDNKKLIENCIISNTDVRIQTNDLEFKYEPSGGAIEVGMINFMADNGFDIRDEIKMRNLNQPKKSDFPFDQCLKMKTVCRHIKSYNGEDIIRVVVKGAPEVVMERCTTTINGGDEMTAALRAGLLKDHISEQMAAEGLKVLSYGYKDLRLSDYEHMIVNNEYDNWIEHPDCRASFESNLVYVATFGMEDPIRDSVRKTIDLIRYGFHIENHQMDPKDAFQVNLRMMTGDHIETARKVAIDCGLLTLEESYQDGVVLSAEEFKERIGEYNKMQSASEGVTIVFNQGRGRFDAVKKKVKVIARCSSEDKFVMVCGIQKKGGLVGMTGDSISDAEAL